VPEVDAKDTRRRLLRTTPKAQKMFAVLEEKTIELAGRSRQGNFPIISASKRDKSS
jgi:hypothetical protein